MKKSRLILIILSVLILLGCISMTVFLLFSNYRNIRLFKQAENNFLQGDEESLDLAEVQLLQLIRNDGDNEAAFVMLGEIARRKKIYPEQVYYCYMAYRLNPLSEENKEKYIESLCFARYFDRLENFLAQENSLNSRRHQLLLYAAGRNGNINKYNRQFKRRDDDNRVGELALLLFDHKHLEDKQRIAALEKFSNADEFLKQEILTAQTELFIAVQDIDRAEKCLVQAYELNQYAFGPALGRFYARYRNLGKAVEVFEKHLSVYHDQAVAIQAAELYCLLNQKDKIAKLRTDYQSDSGNRAMLCSYYFDALIALVDKDMTSLKDLTIPLYQNINSPLAAFMFFCTDIQGGDLSAIQESYNALLVHPRYLNLQEQADNILSDYLQKAIFGKITDQDKFIQLATALYRRKPESFTAKIILLAQKRSNSINIVLLQDALSRFGNDPGVLKIAIEYYLKYELAEAEKLIARYKKNFAQKATEMLRYEIILNWQKKDYEKVSELFRKNFSPAILPEYWTFVSATMREKDLVFMSGEKIYGPFCKSLLMLKRNEIKKACDILENADAADNQDLLFFAAKTLAENNRISAALEKYALFPQDSPYKIAVLLNMAELYAADGDNEQALVMAKRAYELSPQIPETQLCYADKLFLNGKLRVIPDVVNLSSSQKLRRKMVPLWVAGMQQRIKDCNMDTQEEKIRELCRQLLVIAPDNTVALEYLKKLNKMPQ